MASTSPSFQIISSLRYDPSLPELAAQKAGDNAADPLNSPYYLLPYHRDRLLNAAGHFGWEKAQEFLNQDLSQLVRVFDSFVPDQTKPWRLRIVIDHNGSCTVEANPTSTIDPLSLLPFQTTSPSQSSIWRVYVDSQCIVPSAFTTHKTTAREDYTAARKRAGISSPQAQEEVLVVNPWGQIMEGSITTPYFRPRLHGQAGGPEWITPPLSSGGNAGTTRRYALDQGCCAERAISLADLVEGEECWLSNGVRGFQRGVIVLASSNLHDFE